MKPAQHRMAVALRKKRSESLSTVWKRLAPFQVVLPNREKVAAYFRRHRALASALPIVIAGARRTFGPDRELSLELYVDPESDDRHLKLYVRQGVFDAGLLDEIDAFRSQFHQRLQRLDGHLHITTDFRPARGNNGV